MFEGRISGKGNLKQAEEDFMEIPSLNTALQQSFSPDERTEMVSIMTHDGQRHDLDEAYGYRLIMGADGLWVCLIKVARKYYLVYIAR